MGLVCLSLCLSECAMCVFVCVNLQLKVATHLTQNVIYFTSQSKQVPWNPLQNNKPTSFTIFLSTETMEMKCWMYFNYFHKLNNNAMEEFQFEKKSIVKSPEGSHGFRSHRLSFQKWIRTDRWFLRPLREKTRSRKKQMCWTWIIAVSFSDLFGCPQDFGTGILW